MPPDRQYVGIHKDLNGGMTPIGRIIRDAWVFGLLDEAETCENWSYAGIDSLMQQVNAEWDKYGCLASKLPRELFERHQSIHGAAFVRARQAGWSGEVEARDDET